MNIKTTIIEESKEVILNWVETKLISFFETIICNFALIIVY